MRVFCDPCESPRVSKGETSNLIVPPLLTSGLSQFVFAGLFLLFAVSVSAQAKGKTPIIIIPGLTGSELVNRSTGEKVWFKIQRSKDDDVRLPISANIAANRDALIPGDIIRSVSIAKFLPETEIYEKLIDGLVKTGGYREAKWTTATRADATDTFYVFPYDWRRDNVENARLLIRRIDALKRRLGRPDQKFNIIAHSMGGLISRYAAMYGDAELRAGNPSPTWAGARHFDKIFLLGTPNEGSLLSFDALQNGVSYAGSGIKLPWVQNLSRFDVFTIPSIFQLLPVDGSFNVYDEELKPLKIDLYDPAAWDEYDWSIWDDEDFKKRFSAAEQRNARAYFLAALRRAKQFQAALNANTRDTAPVSFYLMGGDCKETQNGVVLRRNEKKDRWITQFNANSFTSAGGTKVSSEMLKPLLYAVGDSVVPKRSLGLDTLRANGKPNVLPVAGELFQCEAHTRLVTNPEIQAKLFLLLNPLTAAK